MISRVYISHDETDEDLAMELSRALWRVGLESYAALYSLSPGISREEKVFFAVSNAECLVALLTREGGSLPTVNQEIGLARGLDRLILPLLEERAELPFLIKHLGPIVFTREQYSDAVGSLIKAFRDLTKLQWLKVSCPHCAEEMTQYLPPQEEVDRAIVKGSCLETLCSYCQNKISLDPRTFASLG
jgi:hypothetical protein